ncbi:hypothetical protein [Pedobacter sp. UYP24]
MNFKLFTSCFLLILVALSCSAKETKTTTTPNAKVELTKLIRKLYKWHEEVKIHAEGFKPLKAKPSAELYSHIDLKENDRAIIELRKTGFFSESFLANYRAIAVKMNSQLLSGKSSWRDGEIASFSKDADDWCNCQDSPENYFDKITLTDIKSQKDHVTFSWTWGDVFFYKASAIKVGQIWKISYLEGFDINTYNWG